MTNKLVEVLTTPNDPNVATSDENLSIGQMYQQTSLPSLARSIFDFSSMNGPTAALFAVDKDALGDMQLLRTEVIVENSTPIASSITSEAVEDLRSQYGEEYAGKIVGKLLRGLANDAENASLITFLTANSLAAATLTRSAPANSETSFFELNQAVNELVLKSNTKSLRTFEAYAVVPYAIMASVMGLSKYFDGDARKNRGLFVAKIGNVSYFLHPDAAATTVFVGLMGDSGEGAATFASYTDDIIESVNPDSGVLTYNIFNRYALALSPLHVTGNEMMHSFTIV